MNMSRLRTIGLRALVATLLASQGLTSAARQGSAVYLRDNSDWWSFIGRSDTDEIIASQEREPSSSNFRILGIDLNSHSLFTKVAAKLGKAVVISRGDGSTGRSQICYQSAQSSGNIHLIFERGEVTDSFYLFIDGPDWKGSNACAKSNLVTKSLSVASGIQLGQRPSQLRAILGKPIIVVKNTYTWSFGAEVKNSTKVLEKARKQHPELSEEDFHRHYDYFYLNANIETNFLNSKPIFLAVSKSETY